MGDAGPRATRQCTGDLVSRSMWQHVIINDCLEQEEIREVNDKIIVLSKVSSCLYIEIAGDRKHDLLNRT